MKDKKKLSSNCQRKSDKSLYNAAVSPKMAKSDKLKTSKNNRNVSKKCQKLESLTSVGRMRVEKLIGNFNLGSDFFGSEEVGNTFVNE